jgi:hypothetical protein
MMLLFLYAQAHIRGGAARRLPLSHIWKTVMDLEKSKSTDEIGNKARSLR